MEKPGAFAFDYNYWVAGGVPGRTFLKEMSLQIGRWSWGSSTLSVGGQLSISWGRGGKADRSDVALLSSETGTQCSYSETSELQPL